ncbi:MAG: LAGLIDADG family homing endonuclease, partial [Candidatus Thorarchaeota archaeon]
WNPEVNGAEIESISELEDIIRKNFPGIAARKDFRKLISDAAHHFELFHEFGAKENIPRGTISSLSKERGLSPTSLKRWIREGAKPRIYFLIGHVPADERRKRIERILSKLNGATNMDELERRLKTLFYYKSMSTGRSFADNQENARKFFQFLKEYASGGTLKNIAKKIGIGKSTINEWLRHSQLPTNVKVASLIPKTETKRGNKWLPLRLDPIQNIPTDFIQVPESITKSEDLLDVLKQLASLETNETKEYEKQFGKLPREITFMYLLGLIVSDGGFASDTDSSAKVSLFASKKYPWSSELGKAFCYAMGRIGFFAERKSDYERERSGKTDVFRVWESEASPFFMWLKNALLGLEVSDKKKETPIHADWVLDMPREWRVAFLQGLADGDGSASIRQFRVNIGTVTNHDFILRLLSTFGLHTSIEKTKVRVDRYDDILKAKGLPFFKHAISRKEGLDELSKIITRLDRSHGKVDSKDLKLVLELYHRGYSCGEIVEKLWLDYGIARSRKSIEGIVRRYT